MQKSQKISNFQKKFFSLETTQNALKFVCNTICAVHDKFQAGISQKRSWSFSRNLWPRICKKSKKTGYLRKIFFSLETTQNALKFVRNSICAVHDKFQAGIFQKRSWSFSRNLWPRICKKNQKISNLQKKIFMLETTLNALKFVCNTICAVHNKFQAGISQKSS